MKVKRILVVAMAAMAAMMMFASCTMGDSTTSSGSTSSGSSSSSNSSSTSSGSSSTPTVTTTYTSTEIFDAIDKAFADKYPDIGGVISSMPTDLDETAMKEKMGITTDMVEDYKGQIAGIMNNCDMLVVVKAKDGKVEDVKKALEKAKEDQIAQFETYPVMGNDKRLEASKVLVEGNYVALVMVGIMPEGAEENMDFTEDVKIAEDTFMKMAKGE